VTIVTANDGIKTGRGKHSAASVGWRVGWSGMEWMASVSRISIGRTLIDPSIQATELNELNSGAVSAPYLDYLTSPVESILLPQDIDSVENDESVIAMTLTVPATAAECTASYFGSITYGRSHNWQCGLALRNAISACCAAFVPTGSPATFSACINAATVTYMGCSTVRPPTPPPPPPRVGIPIPPCYTTFCASINSYWECYACCNTNCDTVDQINCQAACSAKVRNTTPLGPRPRPRDSSGT